MFIRRFIAISLLALSTSTIPAVALAAATPDASQCILREHRVLSVSPYNVEQHFGQSTITRLGGADVRVQAEPGMTPEWLKLTLQQHLASMNGTMPDCAFGTAGAVKIEVTPLDTAFSVKLVAQDPDKAEEVLRHARHLLG